MNFFEQQKKNKRLTQALMVGFFGILLGVLFLLNLLAYGLFQVQGDAELNITFHIILTAAVLLTIATGCFYQFQRLASGGSSVALMLGGRNISPETKDPHEKKLMNVVEEMSIASGVPMPEVFVLDSEGSINAFASGHQLHDSAVAVTTGTIRYLSRDELQGVVAHEFSHILNGDMKINMRLAGMIYGLMIISMMGRFLLRVQPRSGRRKGAGQIAAAGLALWVLGSLGALGGRILQAWISRTREYLADASAIQMTRQPDGLAGALKKIGAHTESSQITHPEGAQVSHFFFASCSTGFFSGLMGTHPPLLNRIRRLDPRFDGNYPMLIPFKENTDMSDYDKKMKREKASSPLHGLITTSALSMVDLGAGQSRFMSRISNRMKAAAGDAYDVQSLIAALICAQGDESNLIVGLISKRGHAFQKTFSILKSEIRTLPTGFRLPIFDLCVPVIRTWSKPQYDEFRKFLKSLIDADGNISVFEFTLYRLFQKIHARPKPKIHCHSLKFLIPEIKIVLSLLSRLHDASNHERSFQEGLKAIGLENVPQEKRDAVSLREFDEAIHKLSFSSEAIKRRVLDASLTCILADNKLRASEFELIRAVAGIFDLALPPSLIAESLSVA